MIRRKQVNPFFAGSILLFACSVFGDTLTVPLTSLSYVDRNLTTGVWNIGLGELHPPLQIANIANLTPTAGPNRNMDIGDGSDGVFDVSTYTNFGTVAGNVITINTDVKNEFKFTYFNLANNMIIRPIGSKPLIIRSQSDVIINIGAGINCSGEDGEPTKPFNEVGTPPTSRGGSGHCGGGKGGDGGNTGLPATNGVNGTNGDPSALPVITGGTGGLAGIDARGGGGGGSGGGFEPSDKLSQDNLAGSSTAPATKGTSGTEIKTDAFVNYVSFGGSGGAGGGGYYVAASNLNGSGAGGGGGGGVIIIHAGRDVTLIDATSFVVAHAGNGGNAGDGTLVSGGSTTAGLGGAGGGASGGTIWIVAARNYTDKPPVAGAYSGVFTRAGLGGSIGVANRQGADGSHGRTWITDDDCVCGIRCLDPKCSVSEDNPTDLSNYGQSQYKIGAFNFYSTAIDLANYRPKINSATVTTTGTGTFTNKIQGSDDPSFSNPTVEVDISQASTVSGHRYVRFHVTINNTSATLPAMVTGLSLDYTRVPTLDFDFKTACGRLGSSSFDGLFFVLILMGLYRALTTKYPGPGRPVYPNYRVAGN